MDKYDVYLYGMTIISNSYLLKDHFPELDTYGEISKNYTLPGGETATAATVLSSLGCSVKLDGNHLGTNTYYRIKDFYKDKSVDILSMFFDESYEGLEDLVLIDKNTRTCFGRFQAYFSDKENRRWNTPKKEDIEFAKVAAIDPFFFDESELAAKLCCELNKKYVSIDCKYDTFMHRRSAVNVISNEFIKTNYKDVPIDELFQKYTNNSDGLVIFTFGAKEILFGRKGSEANRFKPYNIDVVSTLGAGDTFKAGATYGLYKDMDDEELVNFASAAAAVACSSFPLPLNPPTLEKIKLLQDSRK